MAFGSEQWMYSSGGGFYPDEIDQSLRFDTNAYLSRTPSVESNRKTFTWSGWVKRGSFDVAQTLFQQRADVNSSLNFTITTRGAGNLRVLDQQLGVSTLLLDTTALYRDLSAWYHVVVAVDTTLSTSSDRAKLYVNGERITDFISPIYQDTQNYLTSVNTTVRATMGANRPNSSPTLSNYLDGYLAEVNFIDGQALDPTDFGEFKSGVWIPKRYEGTYGTNGFYLDFGNAGSLGADVSGNGNNWTPTNLASTDQMLDSPTNNFATWNPITNSTQSLSEGNLKGTAASSGNNSKGNVHQSSGKWYYEALWVSGSLSSDSFGITQTGGDSTTTRYLADGRIRVEGTYTDTGLTTFTSGDVIGVAYDLDSKTVSFYKNNTLIATKTITIDEGMQPLSYAGGARSQVANFGQDSSFAGEKTRQGNTDANGIGDFYYAPPAGYLALCTANLPAPAIDPAEDDIPADYFNTVLYTGNGSTQSITGVGFQPDLVWGKIRSTNSNHRLHDVVRGPDNTIASNEPDSEISGNGIVSFDSDGFTMDSGTNINQAFTYVAWNWKAGGTAVANTDGTIASQVSANTKAGFSIVTFTAVDGSSNVGHGLDKEPEILIHKGRNFSNGWYTFTKSIDGSVDYARLDTTTAFASSGTMAFDSTTFKDWYSSGDFVAYCFHSVEGFSKIGGTYTGNGSTDGPFVYTGFRPAYVMIKRTDVAGNWFVNDAARDPYNVTKSRLYPNLSYAESPADSYDLTSNGFKIKNSWSDMNTSGGTYIYMAFAEQPFKYANAR